MVWRNSAKRKRPTSRAGCVLLCIALLLILVVVLYVGAGLFGVALPGFVSTQSSITTTSLQLTFPYEGANITLLNAQQSQNFLDDPNTRSDGMVRLNLHAMNPTTVKVSWSYASIAQLVLPDHSLVKPTYVKGLVELAPGKTQSGFVDFAVPSSDSVSKLIARIGAANEAQMDIPLNAQTNLGAYQPQTSALTGQAVYFGLNWTLKSATTGLSIPGQQATGGMRFVTLTLGVDNTLSQTAIAGSPYDYARLKSGVTSFAPLDSSLPVQFQPGANGTLGTLSFLVPQKSTTFTLTFLAQGQNSADQATIPFTIR